MENIALSLNKARRKYGESPWKLGWNKLKRNKGAMFGLAFLIIASLAAIFAPVIAPYDYNHQDVYNSLQPPSLEHIMGTDNLGRDTFSRILYGGRSTLGAGFISVAIASIIGGALGAISAYYGGRADMAIMRVMDVFSAIPGVMMAIAMAATFGTNTRNIMIAIGISAIPVFTKLVRAAVLNQVGTDYVQALRALGASDARIILLHVLPNIASPLIVQITLGVADAILTACALGFAGIGAQPPIPEWGLMLFLGRSYILSDVYLSFFPGLMIMLTILSLNLLGDGLRDAFDTRSGDF